MDIFGLFLFLAGYYWILNTDLCFPNHILSLPLYEWFCSTEMLVFINDLLLEDNQGFGHVLFWTLLKLNFFTLHFHYNLYLNWIISIISYILSLWNLFETKLVANGALDPFKNQLYSSLENKFNITGELTAPWLKSLFILYTLVYLRSLTITSNLNPIRAWLLDVVWVRECGWILESCVRRWP